MGQCYHDFKEYVNIIHKKTLRDIISQHYSINEIKLGLLLNCQKSDKKIKNWLISVHRACKISKYEMSQNIYLSDFRIKLSKISQKLISDIKSGSFNRAKLKKCTFIKKNAKRLPHDIHQLISEISCFISETIDEDNIHTISRGLVSENCILKRKRFSRQIKESLIKYCQEFYNFTDAENVVYGFTNPIDELTEIRTSFDKFDATLKDGNDDWKMSELKLFIMNDTAVDLDPETEPENCQVCSYDDMEFDNFNVVDEWDEEHTNGFVEHFSDNVVQRFVHFIEECRNTILSELSIGGNFKLISCANDGETYFDQLLSENKSVSNIQQSYLLNVRKRLAMVIKRNITKKATESSSDCEDGLIRNVTLCAKPRPFIKILSLKKPNVYVDATNVEDSVEQFLKSIPLPDKTCEHVEKIATVSNEVLRSKDTEEVLEFETKEVAGGRQEEAHVCKIDVTLTESAKKTERAECSMIVEEYDGKVEESILESILDFSEVLIDEFDCTECKEVVPDFVTSNLCTTASPTDGTRLNSNVCDEPSEPDGGKVHVVVSAQTTAVFDAAREEHIQRTRSNYSVYSPNRRARNTQHEFNGFKRAEYFGAWDRDSLEMLGNRPNYYNGTYSQFSTRYGERSTQRPCHNFVRYPPDGRQLYNHPWKYENDGDYRQNY